MPTLLSVVFSLLHVLNILLPACRVNLRDVQPGHFLSNFGTIVDLCECQNLEMLGILFLSIAISES